ncbi:MAG: hypothetical protein HQL31_02980 [Planctomycetes bacterium]|nr:hypothetical protein [Planctomycetota bacterium]
MKLRLSRLLLLLLFTGPLAASEIIWFSGELQTLDGSKVDKVLAMKFALVDSSENILWTNDGSWVLPPLAGLSVRVDQGSYNLRLGDQESSGMSPLDMSRIAGKTGVNLRVWIENADGEFEQVTPDYRLGASGTALTALSVTPAAIGAVEISDASISARHLAPLSVSDDRLERIEAADKVAASALEDKFLRNDSNDTSSGILSAAGFLTSGTVTGGNVLFANAQVSGTVSAGAFAGDGSQLTNLGINSSFIDDGSIVNADISASANIADSKLDRIAIADKVAASAVEDRFLRNDGDDTSSGALSAAGFLTSGNVVGGNLTAGNAQISGTVAAAYFAGDGSQLSNLTYVAISVDSTALVDGSIVNVDISASANISDTKLDQISTSDKVAASAVEDRFLRNDGNDSSTGILTAAGFSTAGDVVGSDFSAGGNIDVNGDISTHGNLGLVGDFVSGGHLTVAGNLTAGNGQISGPLVAGYFSGDGSQLSNLSAGAVSADSASIIDGSIVNIDISASANIADSKLDQITSANKVAASAVEDRFLRNDGDDTTSGILTAAGYATSGNITGGNAQILGTLSAAFFSGDGSQLTNLVIGNAFIADGAIANADISASANISDSKLERITSADKVSASAIEDRFLRNDGNDTSVGTLAAAGFSTSGNALSAKVLAGNGEIDNALSVGYHFGEGILRVANLKPEVLHIDQSSQTQTVLSSSEWQSFVPTITGFITQAEVRYQNFGASESAILSIYDGTGTGGNLLGQQTVVVSGGANWGTVRFSTPVLVNAGSTYSLHSSNGTLSIYVDNSDPYAGGRFSSNATFDMMMRIHITGIWYLTLGGNANLSVGPTHFATNGNCVIGIQNGVAPTLSPPDMVQLYAEDAAGSSELKVRDEAGNITTLSPHNFSLIPRSEPLAWSYFSRSETLQKTINVDMLKSLRLIEKLSGEKLVHISGPEGVEEDGYENASGEVEALRQELRELKAEVEGLRRVLEEVRK